MRRQNEGLIPAFAGMSGRVCCLHACCTCGCSLSPALAFPDRPVRIVVPYAPGGGNDALARVLAQKLEEQWGKPVVVENRSGGNTIIATEYVGRQPPDGYTILMVTTVLRSTRRCCRSCPTTR